MIFRFSWCLYWHFTHEYPPLKNIFKKRRSCQIVINIYAFPPKVFFLLLQLIRHNGSYELLSSLCVRKLLWLYLLLWNHYTLQPSLVGMFIGRIAAKFMYSVPIENSTWLQGPLIFLEMLSFSDIVGMFIRSEMILYLCRTINKNIHFLVSQYGHDNIFYLVC